MSKQAQCPNCGGYKINTRAKIKGYTYTQRPMGARMYALHLAAFSGILLLLMIELMYIFRVNLGLAAIVTGVFAALILWSKGARSRLFERKYLDRVPVNAVYRHHCELCGYEWVWRTGTPEPDIHVRPQLVMQGAERLWGKGRRSAAEGRRSAAEGRRGAAEGRRSAAEGRRGAAEGRRSAAEGRRSR